MAVVIDVVSKLDNNCELVITDKDNIVIHSGTVEYFKKGNDKLFRKLITKITPRENKIVISVID